MALTEPGWSSEYEARRPVWAVRSVAGDREQATDILAGSSGQVARLQTGSHVGASTLITVKDSGCLVQLLVAQETRVDLGSHVWCGVPELAADDNQRDTCSEHHAAGRVAKAVERDQLLAIRVEESGATKRSR